MDKGMFYLICRGKNGVFVDDHFQRREVAKLPLPSSCVIRFPSTQVKIVFTTLTDVQTGIVPTVGISPGEITRLARLDPSQSPFVSPFVSPCPSPTGTISAINSCPGSPGHGPSRQRLPSFEVISEYASKLLQETNSSDGECGGEEEGEDDKEIEDLNTSRSVGPAENNDEDGDVDEETPTPSGSPSRNESTGNKSQDNHQKPAYSYAQLIVQALLGSKDRRQTLSGIYKFISTNYPYYKIGDKGWKNSIRHNLSLNQYFTKAPRQPMSGKGGYWCMHPDFEDKLVAQAYTKRRKKGVPVFPTSGLISRSAPPSPTHHTYMRSMDFVLPSTQLSSTSSNRPSQGFRPPPPLQPPVHPLSSSSSLSTSSQSLPGSPVRKNKAFQFKNYLSPTQSTEWVSEGGSTESPRPKKAKLDNGQESPEQTGRPLQASMMSKQSSSTFPAQHNMGIPYMALFAPVPLPFANQYTPHQFVAASGGGLQKSNSESPSSKETLKESDMEEEELAKETVEASED